MYDEDRPVEAAKMDAIIEAALQPPRKGAKTLAFSGHARRPFWKNFPWRARAGRLFKDVSVAVVVCGDPSASGWVNDCPSLGRRRSTSPCVGLGSRWAQMKGNNFSEGKTSTQYIAELLGLPENLTVQCIIAMGYPGRGDGSDKREFPFDKVSYNRSWLGKGLIRGNTLCKVCMHWRGGRRRHRCRPAKTAG